MTLFTELRRRNVFRVGAAYAVVAWLLIEISDTVFPRLGLPDWTVTFVIALLILGFPLSLFFSWAYELTPEGLKKEKHVERKLSIAPQTALKLDRIIIVALVLALGYFVVDKFLLASQRHAQEQRTQAEELAAAVQAAGGPANAETGAGATDAKSIAVLPFVNMSDDAGNEFFSDGISEELLNLLAKIPELRVISRSSAFAFKGEKIDVPELAQKLNVGHVLEGSVRKAGDRVRITAQLIEARTDTHLWSETYDRTLNDIFAIQDEIAATVVEHLKITLLGKAPQALETDPEAYALYLQARHLARLGTAEGYEQSNELYDQALAIDPDYVAAWNGLARNYNNQAGAGLRPQEEGFVLAREMAGKALAIDPDYAPGHARLGWIAMAYENDLAQAAGHFEQALELGPDDISDIGNAGALLFNLGRLDESIAVMEYVTACDPVNSTAHYNLGVMRLFAGRWSDAKASVQTALRLSPGQILGHYYLGVALLFQGEAEAALEAMQQEPLESHQVKGTALALRALGRQEEYAASLDELIERWGREMPSAVAQVHAYTGDANAAFQWLNQAIAQNDAGLSYQYLDPLNRGLHDDPRWAEFLERVGKSPAQLDAVEFEVNLPGQ